MQSTSVEYVVLAFRLLLTVVVLATAYYVWSSLALFLLVVVVTRVVDHIITDHFSRNEDPTGKYMLITGCDTGIGHETALAAHEKGFVVIAGCLDEHSAGAQHLRSSNVHVVRLDVTSDKSVQHVLEHVTKLCGKQGLWAIVNNAGFNYVAPIEVTSLATFQRLYDVMLMGTVRVTKVFLPLVRRAQGRVVTMSSDRGMLSPRNSAGYCIAKHGIETFSDVLRAEMEKFQVRVSVIQPGHFGAATAIISDQAVKAMREALKRDLEGASENVKEVYGQEALERVVNTCLASRQTSARTVTPVVQAIMHALLNSRPSPRYPVPGTNGLMDWGIMLGRIKPFLPDSLMDMLSKIMHF